MKKSLSVLFVLALIAAVATVSYAALFNTQPLQVSTTMQPGLTAVLGPPTVIDPTTGGTTIITVNSSVPYEILLNGGMNPGPAGPGGFFRNMSGGMTGAPYPYELYFAPPAPGREWGDNNGRSIIDPMYAPMAPHPAPSQMSGPTPPGGMVHQVFSAASPIPGQPPDTYNDTVIITIAY